MYKNQNESVSESVGSAQNMTVSELLQIYK